MATACAHIDLVQAVVPPKQHVCEDVRQDRRAVGASPDLPDMRRHALLRFVAEPPRVEARARQHPSGHRIRRAGRALAVLLPGRRIRGILTGVKSSSRDTHPTALCADKHPTVRRMEREAFQA